MTTACYYIPFQIKMQAFYASQNNCILTGNHPTVRWPAMLPWNLLCRDVYTEHATAQNSVHATPLPGWDAPCPPFGYRLLRAAPTWAQRRCLTDEHPADRSAPTCSRSVPTGQLPRRPPLLPATQRTVGSFQRSPYPLGLQQPAPASPELRPGTPQEGDTANEPRSRAKYGAHTPGRADGQKTPFPLTLLRRETCRAPAVPTSPPCPP